MEALPTFPIETYLRYGLSSVILFALFFVIRAGLHNSILDRSTLKGDSRRRWSVNIRNTLVFLATAGLVFIWAPQLQTFMVSFLAIALAFVIATKELLDCLIGSMYKTASRAYSIGERIEINGIRGNVVDHNFLTTTLLEIGPGQTSHQYTGRAMVIPNSLFLRHPQVNETYSKDYRLHIITIPLTTGDDWQTAESILLEAAREECHPYVQKAKDKMKELEGKRWLDAPSVEPRVTIQLPEPGKIYLLLRIPCPTSYPSRLEQAILRKFLTKFSYGTQTSGENIVNGIANGASSNLTEQVVPAFENLP